MHADFRLHDSFIHKYFKFIHDQKFLGRNILSTQNPLGSKPYVKRKHKFEQDLFVFFSTICFFKRNFLSLTMRGQFGKKIYFEINLFTC